MSSKDDIHRKKQKMSAKGDAGTEKYHNLDLKIWFHLF